jgi:hypothetical protein
MDKYQEFQAPLQDDPEWVEQDRFGAQNFP